MEQDAPSLMSLQDRIDANRMEFPEAASIGPKPIAVNDEVTGRYIVLKNKRSQADGIVNNSMTLGDRNSLLTKDADPADAGKYAVKYNISISVSCSDKSKANELALMQEATTKFINSIHENLL